MNVFKLSLSVSFWGEGQTRTRPKGQVKLQLTQASIFLHLIGQSRSHGGVTPLPALWKDTSDFSDKGCGVRTENSPLLHGWAQTKGLTHARQALCVLRPVFQKPFFSPMNFFILIKIEWHHFPLPFLPSNPVHAFPSPTLSLKLTASFSSDYYFYIYMLCCYMHIQVTIHIIHMCVRTHTYNYTVLGLFRVPRVFDFRADHLVLDSESTETTSTESASVGI